MPSGTYPVCRKPAGFRTLTVSSSVVDLADATGGIPKDAQYAVIIVEAQPIRYRDDAADPTADVGMLVQANGKIELFSAEAIRNFKAIRDGGTDGVLGISYYSAHKAY